MSGWEVIRAGGRPHRLRQCEDGSIELHPRVRDEMVACKLSGQRHPLEEVLPVLEAELEQGRELGAVLYDLESDKALDSPRCPILKLVAAAQSEAGSRLVKVAQNRQTPQAVLERLARRADAAGHHACCNDSLDFEARLRLMRAGVPFASRLFRYVKQFRIDPEVRAAMLSSADPQVTMQALSSGWITTQEAERLWPRLRGAQARSVTMTAPNRIVGVAARIADPAVRQMAVLRGVAEFEEEDLKRLAKDPSQAVRATLAANEHCPDWVLEVMAQDRDPSVRQVARSRLEQERGGLAG